MTSGPLRLTRFPLLLIGLAPLISVSLLGCHDGGPDELIFRKGGTRAGQLNACDASRCTLGQVAYLRSTIEWIGLGNGRVAPPSIKTPDLDELYLKDGSIHPGQLVAITSSTVVTVAGSFDRARVAFVHLAGAPTSTQGTTQHRKTDNSPSSYYVWDGSANVENKYNGVIGRHDWRAEYHLKMCEMRNGDQNSLIHLELVYTFHADQDYDGAFDGSGKQYDADHMNDIHYHGMSTGKLSRQSKSNPETDELQLNGPLYIRGKLKRLDTTQRQVSVPESFATYEDYLNYWQVPERPGWYEISVDASDGRTQRSDKDYKWPGIIYDGIRLTGRTAFFGASFPNNNFAHWIPVHMNGMPDLKGYISDPDQEDVHGALSYPFRTRDDDSRDSPQMISMKWSFKRTKRPFANQSDTDKWVQGGVDWSPTWCR